MTSEGGDGRFLGKVIATRYGGLPEERDLFPRNREDRQESADC
jgi:hypothetical protein